MNRKEFLQIGSLASASLALPQFSFTGLGDTKKLTILHTNDQHSRIEPFGSTHSRNPNEGGFARRATLVDKIRREEKNVLLLDAGDIFQGTPYFNFFGGELEFKLMSMMKYDAATMGNHDFDNGLNGFYKQMPNAKFDFICSNYDFSDTLLEGKTKPYKIFRKGNVKIGVFGLGIELNGLVSKDLYLETKYLDPIEIAQDMIKVLKEEKNCDFVICLSHLGFKYRNDEEKICDIKLAKNTSGIDVILGGHTHTFLKEPISIENNKGNDVLVNQVGWAGLRLGRIDCFLDPINNTKKYAYQNIIVNDKNIV